MEKQSIKATILADSIERIGNNRITTFKLTYPRMIHAELLTHAMLKSNSASSRAIPFKRMVEMVEQDPFIPIKWMKEHKGMQGTEYFESINDINYLKCQWAVAARQACNNAKELNQDGVTKQIVNRLLEPFLWHTIILTGTEFENFFALRAHPMAEIHLQDLAYKMLDAMNNSTPNELKEGEWHIPFGNEIDEEQLLRNVIMNPLIEGTDETIAKVKVSTAISAQISYLKFGSTDYEDLIDLHDSLVIRPYEGKRGVRTIEDPIHASPASHCAQAMTEKEYYSYIKGTIPTGKEGDGDIFNYEVYCTGKYKIHQTPERYGWCHNLRGFKSYRSMLPNENSTDSRLIKK